MAKDILTPRQKTFLFLFAKDKKLSAQFYLTGGTALAAYYLYHRYSEDLDFFSYNKIDILALDVFIKEVKPYLKIRKVDFQQSFNRNIFFLHVGKEILKIEFTYFPFSQVEKPQNKQGVYVDSLLDIAVNKTFTIAQNPRARDFIDLYFIFKKYENIKFPKLVKLARNKFDWQIDPLQLGTQLLKAEGVKDLPRLIHKVEHKEWRNFFLRQAASLSKDIFKT